MTTNKRHILLNGYVSPKTIALGAMVVVPKSQLVIERYMVYHY